MTLGYDASATPTFAMGHYSMTYDPVGSTGATNCGLVKGVRLLRGRHSYRMMTADQWGDTEIDGIYRGQNWSLQVTFKEWNAVVREAICPFAATAGDWGGLGTIGQLAAARGGPIVLTPVSGTPAATNGPTAITIQNAVLAPENDIDIILGNEERDIPVLFKIFPTVVSTVVRFFTLTQS
jgi:hypothetical protein